MRREEALSVQAAGAVGAAAYAPTLNPEYPTAWWIIALAEDVGRHRPLAVRALEHDLVLWRRTDGTVVCQAAPCLHLGAHLGHGGRVGDDSIGCPFHGWRYDASGRVVGQQGPAVPSPSCASRPTGPSSATA